MYKIVITAGGTSEKIDNVRKITNSSTGKLGSIIATKFIELYDEKIEKIYYICAKNSIKPIHDKIDIQVISDTASLKSTIEKLLTDQNIDIFIHLMAVSDYTVDYVTTAENLAKEIENSKSDITTTICNFDKGLKSDKISSDLDNIIIKLKKTPKIISMIKNLSPSTYLVGFKLLDNVSEGELIDKAYKLKEKNNCNLVVANDLSNIRKGNHKAFLIKTRDDYLVAYGKEDIASKLILEVTNDDKL